MILNPTTSSQMERSIWENIEDIRTIREPDHSQGTNFSLSKS